MRGRTLFLHQTRFLLWAKIRKKSKRQIKNEENKSCDEKNSALDNTTDTVKTPKGNGNDTATPESTVSEGKDTKNLKTASDGI
jgi:hypothetical protein